MPKSDEIEGCYIFPEKVIMVQPLGNGSVSGWQNMNKRNSSYTGNELLVDFVHTSHFYVKKYVEILEVSAGCDVPNSYEVENTLGQPLFYVTEDSDSCTHLCLGRKRCFTFNVTNVHQQPIMKIQKTFCSTLLGLTCLDYVGNNAIITLVDGTKLGSIVQRCGFCSCTPTFDIKDAQNKKILTLRAHVCSQCCPYRLCITTTEFGISKSKEKVGVIHKHWNDAIAAVLADMDMFGAEFPEDFNVEVKALILGAIMFLDFTYFEPGEGIFKCC